MSGSLLVLGKGKGKKNVCLKWMELGSLFLWMKFYNMHYIILFIYYCYYYLFLCLAVYVCVMCNVRLKINFIYMLSSIRWGYFLNQWHTSGNFKIYLFILLTLSYFIVVDPLMWHMCLCIHVMNFMVIVIAWKFIWDLFLIFASF